MPSRTSSDIPDATFSHIIISLSKVMGSVKRLRSACLRKSLKQKRRRFISFYRYAPKNCYNMISERISQLLSHQGLPLRLPLSQNSRIIQNGSSFVQIAYTCKSRAKHLKHLYVGFITMWNRILYDSISLFQDILYLH